MILNRLARYGKEKSITIQSLKRVMTAGAPVSKTLLQDFAKLLPADSVIHTPYGATEALPVTDICSTELLQIYGSGYTITDGLCIGYPLENIELKILSISDEPVFSLDDVKISEASEVGEITILGPNVTQEYLADPDANLRSKIFDSKSGLFWHRTGDLGRLDENGRVWYYGRKAHRVETEGTRLFSIPCEAVFNQHPKVFRSALVGVTLKRTNKVIPLICIEPEKGHKGSELLREELLKLASENEITKGITMILFKDNFPVDPRHNAKIFREKLALWAQNNLR